MAIVLTKTNIKYMIMAREEKKKKLKMYTKVCKCRLLKELLKYKFLTSEERSKTPEMKLVYS